jgi:toxin ParE1/3/4
MKLRYSPSALADLESILAYIAERSPQGADKVHFRVRAVMDLLSQHPLMGARTEDPKIRRLILSPYPYLILYEPAEDEIIIRAVRHAARKPSRLNP